jgi:hypothetical protein
MRIEPPPSLPCAIGMRPAATAAAAPPLDPPGVSSGLHGFEVGLGEGDRPELRRVRLADDDEPCFANTADDGGVEVGHVVGERAARIGRADA